MSFMMDRWTGQTKKKWSLCHHYSVAGDTNAKQEMSNDTYAPWPWPTDPKINRGHLLVMTSLHVKYEDSVIKGIIDNQRKPFGLPTNIQTNISKTIYPHFFEGGHKNLSRTSLLHSLMLIYITNLLQQEHFLKVFCKDFCSNKYFIFRYTFWANKYLTATCYLEKLVQKRQAQWKLHCFNNHLFNFLSFYFHHQNYHFRGWERKKVYVDK